MKLFFLLLMAFLSINLNAGTISVKDNKLVHSELGNIPIKKYNFPLLIYNNYFDFSELAKGNAKLEQKFSKYKNAEFVNSVFSNTVITYALYSFIFKLGQKTISLPQILGIFGVSFILNYRSLSAQKNFIDSYNESQQQTAMGIGYNWSF